MKILLFLLLSLQMFGQTVLNETFSDRTPDTTLAKFKVAYLFDPTNFNDSTNYAGTGLDLTRNGGVGDSAISGVLVSGGSAIYFDGTNDYYSGGTDTDYDVGTNSASFHAIVKLNNLDGTNRRLWYKRNTNPGYDLVFNSTNAVLFFRDLTAHQASANIAHGIIDSDWHIVSIVANRTTNQAYLLIDGTLIGSALDISSLVDITGASAFAFGAASSAAAFWKGHIQAAFITNTADSTAEIRQLFYKPRNWVSVNSNVSRDLSIPEFYLTAWSDTLGVPLSDATLGANQEWVFDVQSKDTDGSGSTNWWIGKKREPKSTVKTINCGSSFENDKVYFGDGFVLQSDTLWVAFSDTASVDNVVLSKAKHHLIRNVTRWLTW